jgi:hypothetical protein
MARFNEPIEPMTLGNMRQNGVRPRRVVLAVPPQGRHVRRPVAGRGASFILRAADDVHPLWYHRRRCPAELAGGVEIGAPAVAALPGGSLLPRNRPRTWILLRASDGY